ncbi:MAG TPA: acyl-CoA thioesterase [Candidatus Competibacteraceae bacterium]|nr:acyl-CoA thioesterase [Candidatus Competibacteraceae bacterium]
MTDAARDDSHLFPRDRQPALRILAMPADTNPAGQIFGGWIMSQMDVAGSVVAVEYANTRVATVAVTSMEFHKPVYVGDLVSCFANIVKVGNTSITVKVEVFAQRGGVTGQPRCIKVTEAVIVYVALDRDGRPLTLPRPPA